jgi:hypothetical protein
MPDALPDTTLPIFSLGTGSIIGSNNVGGWRITELTKCIHSNKNCGIFIPSNGQQSVL